MNKYIAKHKKYTQNKLRNLESKNPKDYWKFINSLKKKEPNNIPSLDDFYEHFKNLNQGDIFGSETPGFENYQNNNSLNAEITSDEILFCIRQLNNGKASGIDKIVNEHIKSTSDVFLSIYVKLFNQILDTGHFPNQWSTGRIHPIYKNKGERENPANCRPITILGCLGKLFTSVLNERLNNCLEAFLLNENQAGFRKQFSTLDHIFSLHALIEILKASKQKLFCCFIDFSSAFDCVWRTGLWHKLLQHSVSGKIFNVIINMCENIKSCVSVMGRESAFFSSFSGVRQGENLSLVLFSLYLTDLRNVLERNPECGITINHATDEIIVICKVFVLL